MSDPAVLKRWRLVLGHYADTALGNIGLDLNEQRADRALDYLYAREMEGRGLRRGKPAPGQSQGSPQRQGQHQPQGQGLGQGQRRRQARGHSQGQPQGQVQKPGQDQPQGQTQGPGQGQPQGQARRPGASLSPSQLTPLTWLGELRALFPQSVIETVQAHAIERLGMTELLSDPDLLDSLEPNAALLNSLLAFKDAVDEAVQNKIRDIARKVVDEVMRRLKPRVERGLAGRPNRFRRSQRKSMQNFDWRATIRENLKHYDTERKRIVAERLRFFGRSRRKLPWTIILCVDQSASMLGSTLYAAVMAAIIAGLPSLDVKLVVFDTAVVDLSSEAADPVAVLMAAQLGGGTDIAGAVEYCEQFVTQPTRTVFVLLSDFDEGGSSARLLAAVRRMNAARITLLGLAALSDDATPYYDHAMAERLAAEGMKIAALTPDHFADWLGGIIA